MNYLRMIREHVKEYIPRLQALAKMVSDTRCIAMLCDD